MDIESNNTFDTMALDVMARKLLGGATDGVLTSQDRSVIQLSDDSQSNQSKASNLLNNFGSLEITANLTVAIEGLVDPIITCVDTRMLSDNALFYLVLLDGEVYSQGLVSVLLGVSTLTLVDAIAGVYDIYLARTTGDYSSNKITVTVNET